MSDATCICGQPAPDGYICPACRTRLGNNLERLPRLWDELSVKLAGLRGVDYAAMGEGGSSSETPMAINEAAYNLRIAILASIRQAADSLALDISEVQTLVAYSTPEPSFGFLCRLLRQFVNHLANTEWGARFAVNLDTKIDEIVRKIDSPPARIYAGRCSFIGVIGPDGTPGDPDPDWLPCFTDMWVLEDDRRLATTVRCPCCGATFSLASRREWVLQQYAGYLVTPTEGAALMGIPKDTIKKWATRKRVLPRSADGTYSTDASERRLYLLDDLMELARPKRDDAA